MNRYVLPDGLTLQATQVVNEDGDVDLVVENVAPIALVSNRGWLELTMEFLVPYPRRRHGLMLTYLPVLEGDGPLYEGERAIGARLALHAANGGWIYIVQAWLPDVDCYRIVWPD